MARNWQLLIAGLWLVVAIALAFRETLGLVGKGYENSNFTLGLGVAGVLCLWNLVRWASQRKPQVTASALQPRQDTPPYEYNPELDFQNLERNQGEPSGG